MNRLQYRYALAMDACFTTNKLHKWSESYSRPFMIEFKKYISNGQNALMIQNKNNSLILKWYI